MLGLLDMGRISMSILGPLSASDASLIDSGEKSTSTVT